MKNLIQALAANNFIYSRGHSKLPPSFNQPSYQKLVSVMSSKDYLVSSIGCFLLDSPVQSMKMGRLQILVGCPLLLTALPMYKIHTVLSNASYSCFFFRIKLRSVPRCIIRFESV